MTNATITVRVDDELKRAYDEAANHADSGVTKSDLIREQLARGVEDGTLEIPEEFRTLAKRSRVVDRNKVNQIRGGFRARVVRQFRKRFEAGWKPDEVDLLLEGYREEARVLFDEPDEQIEFIEELLTEYAEKWERSNYDPLEDPFGGYGGVEQAEEEEAEREEVRNMARKMVRNNPHKSAKAMDKLAYKLHHRKGVKIGDAREVIDHVVEEINE